MKMNNPADVRLQIKHNSAEWIIFSLNEPSCSVGWVKSFSEVYVLTPTGGVSAYFG